MGPAPPAARRPFSEMAPRPARAANPSFAPGDRRHCGRPLRTAGRADEPGRRAPVDSLARAGSAGAADRGQRLLHGVSVHAAAHAGPEVAARAPLLAALAACEVAGGGIVGGL